MATYIKDVAILEKAHGRKLQQRGPSLAQLQAYAAARSKVAAEISIFNNMMGQLPYFSGGYNAGR